MREGERGQRDSGRPGAESKGTAEDRAQKGEKEKGDKEREERTEKREGKRKEGKREGRRGKIREEKEGRRERWVS